MGFWKKLFGKKKEEKKEEECWYNNTQDKKRPRWIPPENGGEFSGPSANTVYYTESQKAENAQR